MKKTLPLEEGDWRPWGGWRYNREEKRWTRTYDLYENGKIVMTANRTFHPANGLTEQRRLDSFDR